MSWNGGAITGATSYPPQSQPYTKPQPGYGQQLAYGQYQPGPLHPAPGLSQRPPENRPPKKKGNPIITRYPPPPGYRGPAQPPSSFNANHTPTQFQPQQPGYPQAPPPHGYPVHGYSSSPISQSYPPPNYSQPQPSTYPQAPAYPQSLNPPWPQSGYPSNRSYPQPQGHPVQAYPLPQSGYQGYPSQSIHVDVSQPAYGQASGWPQSQSPIDNYNPFGNLPNNAPSAPDPNATPTPTTTNLVTSQQSQVSTQQTSVSSENGSNGKPQLFLAWDDWDFDFDGAIWPKGNEAVDPNLSLGVIIWHPAKQMTRALPSTFAAAEEEALKPTPEKLDNGESVSMYFMAENSHEAFLDVRQTDEWDRVRDDPIFVIFSDEEMRNNTMLLEECISRQDRPDDPTDNGRENDDQQMHDAMWDIVDNLEQALSGSGGGGGKKQREMGREPVCSSKQTQEEILAMLGVTGLPKPPLNHPISLPISSSDALLPTSLHGKSQANVASARHSGAPLPPQRAQSYGGHRSSSYGLVSQRPYGSMSLQSKTKPPPVEELRSNSWNTTQQKGQESDSARGSVALSEGSNRAMAGSDVDAGKCSMETQQDLPTKPLLQRNDSSRKRSYQDTDHEGEKFDQQDDQIKRKRRLQIDAAYSRR